MQMLVGSRETTFFVIDESHAINTPAAAFVSSPPSCFYTRLCFAVPGDERRGNSRVCGEGLGATIPGTDRLALFLVHLHPRRGGHYHAPNAQSSPAGNAEGNAGDPSTIP